MPGDSLPLPPSCVVPQGYRRLITGEYKQKGDLFFVDKHWERCSVFNVQVNKACVVVRAVNAKASRPPSEFVEAPMVHAPNTAERVKDYLKRIKKA